MIKILGLVDNTTDAMAWYRSVLPFIRIMQDFEDVSVQWISPSVNPSWDLLLSYNILFAQRPHSEKHCAIIAKAKIHGLKIWLDFDDALWAVTPDSPAYNYHADISTQKNIRDAVSMADVITVSTSYLKDGFKKVYGQDAHVIENAVDLYGLQHMAKERNKHKNTILWRGSMTHQNDLMSISEEIADFNARNEVDWVFFGLNPWFITEKYPNFKSTNVGFMDMGLYQMTMRKQKGCFQIVPLIDNEFNRCKSNIAALEAIVCGKIPVVPDWWDEFSLKKGMTVMERLQWLYDMSDDDLDQIWLKFRDIVLEHFSLAEANHSRYELIQDL